MAELRDLIAGWTQPGVVRWIGVRPARRAQMKEVVKCDLDLSGLRGDRARAGKRAVTLVQAEHLPAIGAFLGEGPVRPALLRRNLVVSAINLAALKGREVQVGEAVLRLTVICAPCSRMEEVFGRGGYSAVRGHGGWCAEVVSPGRVAIGDVVRPAD